MDTGMSLVLINKSYCQDNRGSSDFVQLSVKLLYPFFFFSPVLLAILHNSNLICPSYYFLFCNKNSHKKQPLHM